MAGQTLDIVDFIAPDQLGTRISDFYVTWETMRAQAVAEWLETQKYIFATDTTKTTNSKLPWNNKTTIPKLCQIRDNLQANYMASMFPKNKWLVWEGDSKLDEDIEKKKTIEAYIGWVIDRNEFYDEIAKLILDYIDCGNVIATAYWRDDRVQLDEKQQVGYVGPAIQRIAPTDIVVNPTAPSWSKTPKIVRSILSIGEVKDMLERMSKEEGEQADAKELFGYMKEVRRRAADFSGTLTNKDTIYQIAGFDSFRNYLGSNFVEVLTFYGDIYDEDKDDFKKNQIIKVVDRHKVISQRANPTFFGTAPIYHAGWRVRQDNLWAMGPLDNLVGMQYRMDHLENLKADCFDQIAFPPLKVKGYVEDFDWGPFERIYVGDDGDVEVLSPDVQALNADNQIAILESKMEEMAGSPKEAMGFRTPGEKTAYEVQRLENAASRIFQNKIAQFERQIIEPLLNAMLELARRKMDKTTIRVFDTDTKLSSFQELTPQDITGNGRIKPLAARHFADEATVVQNLNNFFGSPAGQDQDVLAHFSSIRTAKLWEQVLDIEQYGIVQENIRLSEKADAQALMSQHAEQIAAQGTTPAGTTPDDASPTSQGPFNG